MSYRRSFFLFVLWYASVFLCDISMAAVKSIGTVFPRFQGSQMNWIDDNGLFLFSNNSLFAFGFVPTDDVSLFLLGIIHMNSTRLIWSANRNAPVKNSDMFVFGDDGKVSLQKGGGVVWKVDPGGQPVTAIEMKDSGNLVMVGNDSSVIWQSFGHPTDTLITNQDFTEGMKLVSDRSPNNLTYMLEIESGDMILSSGFKVPQPYWTMQSESRKVINENGSKLFRASLRANSWKFYDKDKLLLYQFIFVDASFANALWVAVLENDGFISFFNLDDGVAPSSLPTKIPADPCSRPESCDPYFVCSNGNVCQCPSVLSSQINCKPAIVSSCSDSSSATKLVSVGDGLAYFALGFVSPSSTTNFPSCQASCLANCSCIAMFFQNSSGNCFLFDEIGSFQTPNTSSTFASYIKIVSTDSGGGESESHKIGFPVIIMIVIATAVAICIPIYLAYRCHKKRKKSSEFSDVSSQDDDFLDNLSGAPIRYSYKDLQTATNNFMVKLGHGGFGSVYQGLLPDGTRLAVKKLEGIGQGEKEFRAEVSIIGGIHHHHLVRLKGFCIEGSHRLLAYEFMANGSLDKWIFDKNQEGSPIDWNRRFSIALGTAKGLAYLHEDCDVKIIHCDIKPENVLLDDQFLAKVSDFGLAKLMTREQSHIFTTLRGTRGYLAPEWITNYAISEKSDVYSYGMVLLEIIGGRKNFDPRETSERSHFPSYAFKMMGEGKPREILDSKLELDGDSERVSTAIRVALWCIQEDTSSRPSMNMVVQMLEGVAPVPRLPVSSSPLVARVYSSAFFKSISEDASSSAPSDHNSNAFLSAVRLSGPR